MTKSSWFNCPQSRRWTPDQKVWRQIEIPDDMGVDCDGYKWRQNQTHVEIFVRLPDYARPDQATLVTTLMCPSDEDNKQHL